MPRTRVIVNPVAGGGSSAKRWERIEPTLRQAGLEFDAVFTDRPGDACELAGLATHEAFDLIVAVGGDGTVNEVLNGIMAGATAAGERPSLGIIPTGRGVDFCRTMGVPLDYIEAAKRLTYARTERLDIGEAEYTVDGASERRYFANFAGLGFDVEVSRRANTIAPRGGGTVPYLSSVFLTILAYRSRRVEVVVDGEVTRRSVAAIIAANGQYFGGGMRIAPQASLTDGLFDVVVLGDLNRLELMLNLPRIYEGTHITHPKVEVLHARALEVHSVEPVYFQVDGEPRGETPVHLRVIPGALKVIV